jgi:3-methyladenine DNA glycosylase/8-oxoguanine DNA glycosylase
MTPFEIFRAGVLWTGFLCEGEPIGLKARAAGSVRKPRVSVDIFSRSASQLGDLLGRIKKIIENSLGLEEDLAEFYSLIDDYATLRQARNDLYGMRITPLSDILSALILAICLQRVSYGRTERMLSFLYKRYGHEVEFDGKRIVLCPDASNLAEASEQELRNTCGLGYRANYIQTAAESVASRKLPDLLELAKLPEQQAREMIKRIRGIGDYAADVILPHPCFPVDSWSSGIFKRLFRIRSRRSERETVAAIKEFARRNFGRWQRYVYEYVTNDLESLGLLPA